MGKVPDGNFGGLGLQPPFAKRGAIQRKPLAITRVVTECFKVRVVALTAASLMEPRLRRFK